MTFRFEAYANNVRIAPPLRWSSQLGTVRLYGFGQIQDGMITGRFTCSDSPQGTIRGRITGGTYSETGDMRRLVLSVLITRPSTPNFPADATGTLELWDSPSLLPNGQTADGVRLGGWPDSLPNDLATHDHGFNNADPAAWQQPLPPHEPPLGGRARGGLWADVEIGGPREPGQQPFIELTDDNWAQVTGGEKLLVVIFTGKGIPKSKEQLAVLQDLRGKHPDIVFARAEMENCKNVFRKERLRGLPSIGFYRGGTSLGRLEGFAAEGPLGREIEKHRGSNGAPGLLGIPLQGPGD